MVQQHAIKQRKHGKAMTSKVNYSRYGYFFVAPFIIAFVVFTLYSIIFTVQISFTNLTNWRLDEMSPVGIENYKLLLDPSTPVGSGFWAAFSNTLIIWVVNFVPQLLIALLLAQWFTDSRLRIRFQGGFKVLIFMPNTITAATIAILFYALFTYPIAPVNTLLQQLGFMHQPVQFFRSVSFSRGLISFLQWWMWYGNTMIVLIAGILGINPDLFEAGLVDGCNSRQMFTKITLPLLRPIMLYTLVTSMIGGLQMFDIPQLLTQGDPQGATNTVARFIYRQAFFGSYNFNYAAAASIILFFIILVMSLLLFYFMRERGTKLDRRVGK